MTADELKAKYLSFFQKKEHAVISGSSLVPENDPTVLFTTAGMHPLVPYLLGEPHPAGKRICNCQKCIRTGDIDEVGDVSHLTFFEMLGNWSFGDYFKEEAIAWSYEFIVSSDYLGLDPDRLSVTVFEGNEYASRDEESIAIWRKQGIPMERIFALPAKDNWWGIPGGTGPCGPDTEMFINTDLPVCGSDCRPGCSCGKYFEVWNNVFMQYQKTREGKCVPLKQKNVDTGMGVERTAAMLQGKRSVFETELFVPLMKVIEDKSGRTIGNDVKTSQVFRILADHMRSSVFILGDARGMVPGNLGQGYVLRRLIRRSVRYAKMIGLDVGFTRSIAERAIKIYKHAYPELESNKDRIIDELVGEEEKFEKTLNRGIVELNKVLEQMKMHNQNVVPGRVAFRLYDTCGFPLEFTEELCAECGVKVDKDGFDKAFNKHKEVSRQGADKAFKGGLADSSIVTVRLHTATHLLHKSLQMVLGDHVQQKGSNITPDRLRFDFSHHEKMTPEEIQKVENLVNDVIVRDLPVSMETMTLEEARSKGATALFGGKYEELVKVYTIGDFSQEVCGGPHVKRTRELGQFKIIKEESSSAGTRRIRAILTA